MLPSDSIIPINSVTRNNVNIDSLIKHSSLSFEKYEIELQEMNYTLKNAEKIIQNLKGNINGGFYVSTLSENSLKAAIFGNIFSPHSPTLYANLLSNLYLKHASKNEQCEISMKVQSLEMYRESWFYVSSFNIQFSLILVTLLSLLFPLISFWLDLLQESTSGIKQYLYTNRLRIWIYWAGNYAAHSCKLLNFLAYSFPLSIRPIIIIERIVGTNIHLFWVLLIISIGGIVVFEYFILVVLSSGSVLKFISKNQVNIVVFFCIGVFAMFPIAIGISLMELSAEIEEEINNGIVVAELVLRIIPIFNMLFAFSRASEYNLMTSEGINIGQDFLLKSLGFALVDFVLYGVLLLIVETRRPTIRSIYLPKLKGSDLHLLPMTRKKYSIFPIIQFIAERDRNSHSVIAVLKGSPIRPRVPRNNELQDWIGWVLRGTPLFPKLTVQEHMNFYEKITGSDANIVQIIKLVGLQEHIHKFVHKLSEVKKIKLVIAISLISSPSTIVFECPSSSLNLAKRKKIWDSIIKLAGRVRIIFLSPIIEEINIYANKFCVTSGKLHSISEDPLLSNMNDQSILELNPSYISPPINPRSSVQFSFS